MRPIIGVHGDCLWPCGDVCHSPPSISAPRSHGKLRSMLTGTGVGSNFRFVADLELKPAKLEFGPDPTPPTPLFQRCSGSAFSPRRACLQDISVRARYLAFGDQDISRPPGYLGSDQDISPGPSEDILVKTKLSR